MSGIRDVAKLAGVSPATVSRVMNGTAKVGPEKRERVEKAIHDTGFVPNEVARSLFKKSARLIGLIIPSLQNPFFTRMAACIDEAAASLGYRVFLRAVGHDSARIKNTLQLLASMNADGVVLAVSNGEVEKFLSDYDLPVVAVDCMETSKNVTASFCCDYYNGGRIALQHLLDCGCKKIVCIKSDQRIFSARQRYQGYHDLCREQGIQERTVECDYDFQSGLDMTEKLLQSYPDADGILACNDIVAVSTFKILHKKQILVPEQVQLVGFDDINLSRLISPELTTIHQPIQEMAEQAVNCLVSEKAAEDKIQNPVIFPVSLVIRETTRNLKPLVRNPSA